MRFSANTGFLWRDRPFLERIERAALAGFEAVEFHDEAQSESLRELKRRLAATDVTVTGLNTAGGAALPGREREARDAIDHALHVAREVGAGYVHVVAGDVRGDDARAAYLGALAFAVEQAGNIDVVIEPISEAARPSYHLFDLGDALRVARATGARVMFDCFHIAMQHGDVLKRFRTALPTVAHVQIASVPERHEPSVGTPNYAALLPAMVEAGYTGAFGCEYVPAATVEAGLGWRDVIRGENA